MISPAFYTAIGGWVSRQTFDGKAGAEGFVSDQIPSAFANDHSE